MRILLVSPKSRVWNSRTHIHNGLGYLAGALIHAGYHNVDIYDGDVEDESLDTRLSREPFDVVGISSPTPLIYEAWRAAQTAKAHGAITILGGPHLTLMPDESLGHPSVDFVARGEAEETIVEFARALAPLTPSPLSLKGRGDGGEGSPFAHIKGLSFRGAGGQIVHNVPRPLAQNLDAIPFPAYHLFKIDRYTNLQPLTDGLDRHARTYTVVTSRGCPYQCTYCSKPITGNTWRARSVDNVLAEWKMLVQDLRAKEIGVTDDIWNLDLKRAKELCRGLIDQGLNHVPWITIHGMKVNHTDPELFQLMKRAGCKRVGFGVESGDEFILKRVVKKSQTLNQVRAAFRNAKAAGLETMGFFIFGMPYETEETMEKTIRLALELDPDLANFMIAAPYPGTEMWDLLEREGRIYARDWGELAIHSDHAHFEIGSLKPELVERKWHEAYRRFVFRPKRLARLAISLKPWRNLPTLLRDARRFLAS
jgi:anaerobic magnesium-protoporphyrin IX monomethyl ester cyclase